VKFQPSTIGRQFGVSFRQPPLVADLSIGKLSTRPARALSSGSSRLRRLMIFDLFYNQFAQIIDPVELTRVPIFRTIPTDYDLLGWSRIHISWSIGVSTHSLEVKSAFGATRTFVDLAESA
jgi:hypothetical protein